MGYRSAIMFKFHDVEQNSDDWVPKLRAGKFTSSNAGKQTLWLDLGQSLW